MSLRVPSTFVGAVLVLAAACSHEVHRPPPGVDPSTVQPGNPPGGGGPSGDGGVVTDAGTVIDGSAGACNDLTLSANLIDQTAVAGDPPTGTGGTIQDGTYDLTDSTLFVGPGTIGPTGTSLKDTISIAGGTMQEFRVTTTSSGPSSARLTFTISVTNASLALTETCPTASAAQQFTFTVTGSQLSLINPTTRVEFVYTKK